MKLVISDTSANHFLLGTARPDQEKLFISARILPVSRVRDDWVATSYEKYFPSEQEYDGYALGQGPGSFTALRMSFAFFKTLAMLSEKKVFLFSSPLFWRYFFNLTQQDIFLQKINRTMYYAHFSHENNWHFLSGTLDSLKQIIKEKRSESKTEYHVWDEIWRKNQVAENLTSDPRIHFLKISDITEYEKEFSMTIPGLFLTESDWQNAAPDYGHELSYITQEQQKKLKI